MDEKPEIQITYDVGMETWVGILNIPGEFYMTCGGDSFQTCLYKLADKLLAYELDVEEVRRHPDEL